uniref:Uncharacterized protein n=1 Tax=Octactis speculum TaxID=3111310 RepID=A0A6U3RWT2_9STRA
MTFIHQSARIVMQFDMENMQQATDAVTNSSAEELHAHAAEMRSNPGAIRAAVPAMMGLTDEQIREAADNIERMAEDADLLKETAQKVKGMSEEDVQRMNTHNPPPKTSNGLGPGDRVRLIGLTGAAGLHNGKVGMIARVHNVNCALVAVEGFPKPIALKPENLELVDSAARGPSVGSLKSNAQAMKAMDGAKLRAQAKMMREMDPAALRKLNPAFASMTNEEIKMAADQMEQLADNPELRKQAVAEIEGYTPEQLAKHNDAAAQQRYLRSFEPGHMKEAADEMMATPPEELKEQAAQMRSDPAKVRATVPAMAHLSDEQICAAADNLDRMADNSSLLEETSSKIQGYATAQITDRMGKLYSADSAAAGEARMEELYGGLGSAATGEEEETPDLGGETSKKKKKNKRKKKKGKGGGGQPKEI